MNVRIEMNTVSENLRKVTGITSDIPVLEQSMITLNKVLFGLKNPYKPLEHQVCYAGELNLRLKKYIVAGAYACLSSYVRVGAIVINIDHYNRKYDNHIYFSCANKDVHIDGLRLGCVETRTLDFNIRTSGNNLHVDDITAYKTRLAEMFKKDIMPLIDAYVEEETKDSILHNGVTLHNYNHKDELFPMTVKFYSEWEAAGGVSFQDVCDKLYLPCEVEEWHNVVELKTINDFTFLLKALGNTDVNMDVLNYINKTDCGYFYFVEDYFLSWNGVLTLKILSDYDCQEDENNEFFLRDPVNFENEIETIKGTRLGLEFTEYDGRFYYFVTESEVGFQSGTVFELQKFIDEWNLPISIDEEFMESIFEKDLKSVTSIPFAFDGTQLSPYIHEKIAKTYFEEN